MDITYGDVSGADLVVLEKGADVDAELDAVRRLSPAAVVLVAGDRLEQRCRQVYETTLFPRGRIIGVSEPSDAAEAIVFERNDEHEVVAMADGEFGVRRARLGRGGIRELL